jgi:hypothetical protein
VLRTLWRLECLDGSIRMAKPLRSGNDRVTGSPVEKDQQNRLYPLPRIPYVRGTAFQAVPQLSRSEIRSFLVKQIYDSAAWET